MYSKLRAIARYTLLEYLRGRLILGGLALVVVMLGLEQLLDSVAISEARATQASLAGSLARPALVLLLASAVIVSHVREAGDRSRDWFLATALARPVWLGGRLLGHLGAAVLLSVLAWLCVAPAAGAEPALRWASGCGLELALTAVMASFLAMSLRHAPIALLAFVSWYLLARSMAALQLIAAAPLLADGGATIGVLRAGLDLVAVLLPRLDLFAPSLWLEGHGDWAALALPLGQALVYGALLVTAAVVDLQRSEW